MFCFRLKKNKKNGLFLSMELIAVIVIISVLVVAAALSAGHLYNIYKIYTISKEFSTLSEGIIKFKQEFSYWPGDIPKELLKSTLNLTDSHQMIVDYNAIEGWSGKDRTVIFGTGSVRSMENGILSFRQLALSGLIPNTIKGLNLSSKISDTPGYAYSVETRFGYFPKSDINNTSIVFCGGGDTINTLCPANSQVYAGFNNAATYGTTDIPAKYLNKFKLVFGYGVIATKSILDISSTVTVTANGTTWVNGSGISAILAQMIDQKLDDGLPYGHPSRKIFSENMTATGGNGCTTPTATPVTLAELTNAKYQDNSNVAKQGCFMTFMIDYNEM